MDTVKPGDMRQGCIVSATSYYGEHLVYWLEGDQSTAFYADSDDIAQCSLGNKHIRVFGRREDSK